MEEIIIKINGDKIYEIKKINKILGDNWPEVEKTVGYGVYNALVKGLKVYIFKNFVYPNIIAVKNIEKQTEKALLLEYYVFERMRGEFFVYDLQGSSRKWFAKSTIQYIFSTR